MVVNEYGSPTDPAVILLAPMMVSGSDLYELMSPHFSGTYYFIAPDQGGHGKAGSYKNADDEYRQLKAWLLDNGIQKIEFLFAASLGVAVAWKLFSDPAFEVRRAWFDGVALTFSATALISKPLTHSTFMTSSHKTPIFTFECFRRLEFRAQLLLFLYNHAIFEQGTKTA